METILFAACLFLLFALYRKGILTGILKALFFIITIPVYFPVALYRNHLEWYRAGGNKRVMVYVSVVTTALASALWMIVIFL
jgi:hypothetical protein